MATAITDSSFKDGHGCSICLDEFTSPRQLPCLHSFCEHCLQDYITEKAGSTDKIFKEFMCPVCRAVTIPANKEKPVEEWASLYPHSPFPLVGKSKVERTCEVCSSPSDSSRNLAEKFCTVCDEFMCGNCAICHQKMKMGKSHQMIPIEEFASNPQTRMRLREGFGCPEHDNDDIRFYCRSHEAACCATCSFLHHKTCEDVLELKHHLPDLLKGMNPQKIIEKMRKLEDHLKNFMKMNEENIDIVESHVNNISAEIGDIRKKLNDLIDDTEKMVKLEGNRIYKEWLIRKQEQNHQCQSLVSAIINSQALLDTVDQYGSDTQKFMVTRKTTKQLQCYSDQIREKFEIVDNIRIRLELDNNMKAVLSKDAVGLVTIAYEEEAKDFQCTSIMIPLEKRSGELSEVIDIQCVSTNEPYYFGIVQLPDGYIVLADSSNMTCCLYDTSYNLITSHTLTGNPYGMCVIDDNEVAIAMPHKKTIQFLSIRDHSIRNTETLTTKYKCCGIDAVSVEEIVASGPCGDTYSCMCYWSLITRNGNVKLHHKFECRRTSNAYAALDRSKSRVYISVSGSNAVYCFGLTDGKRYFVYSSNNLVFPLGVSVDREDNIYVVGYSSTNIHKLSSNGDTLQVITSGVPQNPRGISFDYSRHHFVITNGSHANRKLHYFVYK